MDKLFDTVITIAAMAFICMLLEYLLPEGKLKKTACAAIGVVFVISLALPVINLSESAVSVWDAYKGHEIAAKVANEANYEEFFRQILDDIYKLP